MTENIEAAEQSELMEKKELAELMERDTASEALYTEYSCQKDEAGAAENHDMETYYRSKCKELVQEKAGQLEQLELSSAQRDALIERYDAYAKELRADGHPELSTYYKEAVASLRQEQAQEKQRAQEREAACRARLEEVKAEQRAIQAEYREWKAKAFAPKYYGV